jgi:hypothetical protein
MLVLLKFFMNTLSLPSQVRQQRFREMFTEVFKTGGLKGVVCFSLDCSFQTEAFAVGGGKPAELKPEELKGF